MSATYVLPIASDTHRLRLRVGDTDVTAAILQDEEYAEVLLDAAANLPRAEAYAYQRIAAKFARMADTTEGDVSVKASQMHAHYAALATAAAAALESGGAGAAVAPAYAGGTSRADVLSREADADRLPNVFNGPRPPAAPAAWWGR